MTDADQSERRQRFADLKTPNGHAADEVSSALQKAVRRGDEEAALYWATELETRFGPYLWSRLQVIASEDVGLADTQTVLLVAALHDAWQTQAKRDRAAKRFGPTPKMLYVAHAVIALSRAKKSRMVDNACVVMWSGDRKELWREVPEEALDAHTARGRAMGKTEQSAYAESYRIENAADDVPDPYREQAMQLDLGC